MPVIPKPSCQCHSHSYPSLREYMIRLHAENERLQKQVADLQQANNENVERRREAEKAVGVLEYRRPSYYGH